MDLARVRDELNVGVMGAVNVDLLGRGTPEEVQAYTLETIRKFSTGGRHILSSANSISTAVNPPNFEAMVATVKKHGAYPISI